MTYKRFLMSTVAVALAAAGMSVSAEAAALRVAIWTGNQAHLDLFNGIADAFRQSRPDVTEIVFETLPFENYTTTLTTQLAGGNAPDLAWIFESSAPDFVSSGALVPLTDVLKETEGYDYDDLLPSATALWQQDGQLYAFPFSTSPFGVFANTDLLAEAGQKTPDEMIAAGEWTWQTVMDSAAAVHAGTGKAGLVVRDFEYRAWYNLATIWGGWGAAPWRDGGQTCTFDAPEMVAAMTFIHDAIFAKEAMPGPGTTADFFAGEAAFTITQISRASLLKDGTFKWDLVPLPAGPGGGYAAIGQAGLGVFRSGANADLAVEFLAFMTNPENSAKMAQFFPPPRTSLLKAETLAQTNPLLQPKQIEDVVIAGIMQGQVLPSHTGAAQLSQTVRAELDSLWQPDADVEEVLGNLCARISPLLAQ